MSSTQTRVFAIDVLRGLAILLVMGVHVQAYPIWSTVGWIGVDLFFVLSGFLIGRQAWRGDSLLRFRFKRVTRILPRTGRALASWRSA